MKIGLFSDRYLPHTDGIVYSIESFRLELEKLGHDVYVIAPAAGLRVQEANPKVIRFPAIKGLFFEDYSTSLFFPPQVIRKLDKLGLDIVHFHTPSQIGLLGAYYALRNNLPLITTYHTDLYEYVTHYPAVLPGIMALSMIVPMITGGGMTEYRTSMSAIKPERSIDKWNQKIVERSLTLIHNHCDIVIAPSQKMKRMLMSWNTTAPVEILPTGVDEITTTTAKTEAARKRYGFKKGEPVVLFVGRIGGEKNIELLLKAFEIVAKNRPLTKLLYIGEGPDRQQMIAQVRELGLSDRVLLPGQVNRTELGAIYNLATMFAFPSVADTQGLVIHEAALAKLPIILIDPNVSEIIRNNTTGLYAKPAAKDLALKIMLLLDKPDLRTKLGAAAREAALAYSAKAQAIKLAALYTRATAKHPKK